LEGRSIVREFKFERDPQLTEDPSDFPGKTEAVHGNGEDGDQKTHLATLGPDLIQ
jgi:hypothetical protein